MAWSPFRASLWLLAPILAGCSCGASETAIASGTSEVSSPAPVSPEAPAAVPVAEPSPPSEVPAGVDRCEGLVGPCGGWIRCVMVRADPTTPGSFVGVGPDVGHLYGEEHSCHDGICNEVCTGGSLSGCRAGLIERETPVVCSAAQAPSRAPFTCWMQDGACVQGPDPDMMPAS